MLLLILSESLFEVHFSEIYVSGHVREAWQKAPGSLAETKRHQDITVIITALINQIKKTHIWW